MADEFQFSGDLNQLFSLIFHASLYANKDIFLRELISNSSDALEKIRSSSSFDSQALNIDQALEIRLIPDKTNNTLTIEDTGIGMTKAALIDLGTIGLSKMSDMNAHLIGQFGVGFYSAFLVANKLIVHSKHINDEQFCWECVTCGRTFTVSRDQSKPIAQGTRIVLHLKEDMQEYLGERRLRDLVQRHSAFITFPIRLLVEREREMESPEEGMDILKKTDQLRLECVPQVAKQKTTIKRKKVKQTINSWCHLNPQPPIWMSDCDSVSCHEYACLYKTITHEFEEQLAVKHFSIDGELEFHGILFIPKRAPYDMFHDSPSSRAEAYQTTAHRSIKLYVKHVLVLDNSEYNLMPNWLQFVKGLVDFEHLPLNISRESLVREEDRRILDGVKKILVKKIIELIHEIAAEDEMKYEHFYWQYDRNVKLGIHEDPVHCQSLAKLLRYSSTKSGNSLTSLDDYLARMPDGQDSIYFLSGESLKAIRDSPYLEKLKRRSFEILLMVDPIDEYVVQQLKEYQGIKLVNVAREGLKIRESEEERRVFQVIASESLCEIFKTVLGNKVKRVVLSKRLEQTPCVLVLSQFGRSAILERIMKGCHSSPSAARSNAILEINPTHPIINSLGNIGSPTAIDKISRDIIGVLFDIALIVAGFILEDPSIFAKRIHRLVQLKLSSSEQCEDESDEEGTVLGGDEEVSDSLMTEVD
jgi:molecular chaperone HtpG